MESIEVSAHDLRVLAEQLDGTRGVTLCVVRDAVGKLQVAEDTPASRASAILVVNTPDVPPRTTRIQRIDITPPPIPEQAGDIATEFDALFWSQSAVEKFLVPYYARLLLLDDVKRLSATFEQPDVYAIAHYPRTVSLALRPMVLHPEQDPTKGEVVQLKFSSLQAFWKNR